MVLPPWVAAEDPAGNTLIGDSNWNFVKDNNNQITVTYPSSHAAAVIDMMTHAEASSGNLISRMMSGPSDNTSIAVQSQTLTNGTTGSVTFTALNNTYTGIDTDPFSSKYMYITFRLSDNSILIS